MTGLPCSGAGVHQPAQGNIIGIVAQAHVLYVHQQHVELPHGLRRGPLLPPVVEGEDGHARLRVGAAGHVLARVGAAAEAMLGREDSGDVEVLLQQDVQQMPARHHARVVGEEGNALPPQQGIVEVGALVAGDDALRLGLLCAGGQQGAEQQEEGKGFD